MKLSKITRRSRGALGGVLIEQAIVLTVFVAVMAGVRQHFAFHTQFKVFYAAAYLSMANDGGTSGTFETYFEQMRMEFGQDDIFLSLLENAEQELSGDPDEGFPFGGGEFDISAAPF